MMWRLRFVVSGLKKCKGDGVRSGPQHGIDGTAVYR